MQSELLKKLAAEGCDIEKVLDETYCGRESLMVRIISKVPNSSCLERLSAAVSAGDATAAFEAAHELKGVYAVSALTPLLEKCCVIVEITRKRSLEGVAELLPDLQAMHSSFCKLIIG